MNAKEDVSVMIEISASINQFVDRWAGPEQVEEFRRELEAAIRPREHRAFLEGVEAQFDLPWDQDGYRASSPYGHPVEEDFEILPGQEWRDRFDNQVRIEIVDYDADDAVATVRSAPGSMYSPSNRYTAGFLRSKFLVKVVDEDWGSHTFVDTLKA